MSSLERSRRVVVCGTGFGRVYLSALRGTPQPFTLTGIFARGSARSQACAARYGVPLLRDVDEVARCADIACVIVPNGVAAGPGANLAMQLLERGVHVLHEHPIHVSELGDCLRAARRHGAVYQLNTFYPDLAPVRRFLKAAELLRSRQRLMYAEAACAVHVSFDTLDILGRVTGLHPWRLRSADHEDDAGPFRTVLGNLGGVPLMLRVLNELDPEDPDNHMHLLHRCVLGFEGGTLTLASTHGPVSWSPAIPAPRGEDGQLDFDPSAHGVVRTPSVAAIGPASAPSYRDAYASLWPAGVRRALARMSAAIDAREDPLRAGQTALTVSQIWQELTRLLGYPRLVRRSAPAPVTVEELARDVLAASPELEEAP